MMIVAKDNFDRETRDETVVAMYVNEFYAPRICAFLQEKFGGEDSDNFYVVKSDDYVPYKFEP